MTIYEEYEWLISVMADLNRNYPEHNSKVLDELISIIKYRIECLDK